MHASCDRCSRNVGGQQIQVATETHPLSENAQQSYRIVHVILCERVMLLCAAHTIEVPATGLVALQQPLWPRADGTPDLVER